MSEFCCIQTGPQSRWVKILVCVCVVCVDTMYCWSSSFSDEGTEHCSLEVFSVSWPVQGTQVPADPCPNGKFPGQLAWVTVGPGLWYMNDDSRLGHKAAGVGRDPGTACKGETHRRQLSGGCWERCEPRGASIWNCGACEGRVCVSAVIIKAGHVSGPIRRLSWITSSRSVLTAPCSPVSQGR